MGNSRPVRSVQQAVVPAAANRVHIGRISWVAAHGGAGASTMARLLGGSDLGCRWPFEDEPNEVILVARTHAAGLRSASRMLDEIRQNTHSAYLNLLGIVLVADAPGHLPPQLVRRVRVLKSAVTTHRIPWIPSLRLDEKPSKPTKELVALYDAIRQQLAK